MIDRMEERFGMSKERIGEGIDLLLRYRASQSEESFENREYSGLSWFLRFAQNDTGRAAKSCLQFLTRYCTMHCTIKKKWREMRMRTVAYSDARQHLKDICDEVSQKDETIIITRRDGRDVVMLSMEKYSKFLRIFNDMTNGLKLSITDQKLTATADLPEGGA